MRCFLQVLDETLSSLTGPCRVNLKKFVVRQLIDRCNELIQSVQDIPRMYRKTNREVHLCPGHFARSSVCLGADETFELHCRGISSSSIVLARIRRHSSHPCRMSSISHSSDGRDHAEVRHHLRSTFFQSVSVF